MNNFNVLSLALAVACCLLIPGGHAFWCELGIGSCTTTTTTTTTPSPISSTGAEPLNWLRHTFSVENMGSTMLSNAFQNVLSLWKKDRPTTLPSSLPRFLLDTQLADLKAKGASCTQQIDTTVIQGYQFNNKTGKGNSSITALYDVQGVIAGVVVRVNKTELHYDGFTFREDLSLLFNNETVNGQVYTCFVVYFVPKASICSTGRTNTSDFDTVTELNFQGAESEDSLLAGPKWYNDAISNTSLKYSNNNCFPGMGKHTFHDVENMEKENCNVIVPVFLLFNTKGYLIGFGLAFVGYASDETMLEHPPEEAVKMIVGKTVPACLSKLAADKKLTTVHFFFTKRTNICI